MAEIVLETRGVTKSFGALRASKDISLDLRYGEIHAVIGPNGAGKSTLIAQVCGTLAPDAGSVHLLGEDVTTTPARLRARKGLSRTFQISALAMEDTVLENALIGALDTPWRFFRTATRDAELREKAEAALARVGLADHARARTGELSHGQRRQLEVAVALTQDPKLLVMDEPMAGMGAEGSKALTGFLDALCTETPILLVEHDMDAVFALADRITVLDYGEVIATGTPDEIRANETVRSAYLGAET